VSVHETTALGVWLGAHRIYLDRWLTLFDVNERNRSRIGKLTGVIVPSSSPSSIVLQLDHYVPTTDCVVTNLPMLTRQGYDNNIPYSVCATTKKICFRNIVRVTRSLNTLSFFYCMRRHMLYHMRHHLPANVAAHIPRFLGAEVSSQILSHMNTSPRSGSARRLRCKVKNHRELTAFHLQ
jgi:hypothetical protein